MPRTLLLADDSVTIQKVVGISFANEDVVLLTVDNGDDAVARAREARPDLVLADVVMPGMNGYDVCEAIKSDPALQHIPVLLLTGTFEPFDEERARRAGADGHITKPFEAQALVDQVNTLLERSERSRTAATPAAAEAPTTAAASPSSYNFFDDETEAPASTSGTVVPADPDDDLEVGSGEDEALELETAVDDMEEAEAELAMPRPFGAAEAARAVPESERDVLRPMAASEPTLEETDLTGMGFEATFDPPAAPDTPMQAVPERPAPGPAPASLGDDEDLVAPRRKSRDWNDTTGGRPFDLDFIARSETPEQAEPASGPLAATSPDPLAPLEAAELADEAVLDPEAARGHDVSVSDLGDPLADFDTPTARPVAPEAAALREVDAWEAAPASPVTADLGDDTAPDPAAPVPSGRGETASSERSRASTQLSQELQRRIHESIEKIAWESFGDLSERIVGETVRRVEAVAWEVIPQMAEAMIREEIRRLKEEDESSS